MSPAVERRRLGALPMVMRALLALGFLFAIGATGLVVFSEQIRWLRFAVVLGLWAALFSSFAMVWFRRDALDSELRTEADRRTYELELDREISARREYGIGLIEATRQGAESRHEEALAGLREQLDRFSTSLSGLLEGDLVSERLALKSEPTRVRHAGDSGRDRLSDMAHQGRHIARQQLISLIDARSQGEPVTVGPTVAVEPAVVDLPRETVGRVAPIAPARPDLHSAAESKLAGEPVAVSTVAISAAG